MKAVSVDWPLVRILVVTPSLPLPFGTADARWLYVMVRELSDRGHDVMCLSCTEESNERIEAARVISEDAAVAFTHVPLQLREGTLVRKLRSLRRPFSEYARVSELEAAIDDLSAQADVVHIEHLFPSWAGLGRDRTVTYLHHLEIIDWERREDLSLGERVTRWQMRRATQRLLSSSSKVIGATSRLTGRASAINPRLDTALVPVSIDPARYESLPLPDGPVVGLIGSMNWYPSRSAAERVLLQLWPEIHRRVPDARLLVAGWNSERTLGHLFPRDGAELLGTVDTPEDFFSQVGVLLYPPARGSGCKIKVMEAMAYGRAVVSNSEGFEGLTDWPNDLIAADDDDEALIERTVALLEDPERRESQGRRGRTLIENSFGPVPAVDRLENAYEQLGLGARLGEMSNRG